MAKLVRRGNCPSCGAPIEFHTGSARVVVCGSCSSVVARSDQRLEDLGKVAPLVDSASALRLGLRGVYEGKSFELVGHAQYRHHLGGLWDEWYAAFSNGKWGWLAEAQGRFTLTFEVPPREEIPPARSLRPGAPLPGSPAWTVSEVGSASLLAAEGELPHFDPPGAELAYADLSSSGGGFGTIDYSAVPPITYFGVTLRLGELGFNPADLADTEPRSVDTASLSCPNCGGAVELRAPDQSERVVCSFCSSLLDSRQGVLRYLEQLKPSAFPPLIPMGHPVQLEEHSMLTIGHLVRECRVEGETYRWEEYLLYHPAVGFRWLVYSDRDWLVSHAVPPAEVDEAPMVSARYGGHTYAFDQAYDAQVVGITGELYWGVALGETVAVSDYASGTHRLSREEQAYEGGGGEVNWSAARVLPSSELRQRTGLKLPVRGTDVAQIVGIAVAVLLIIIVLFLIVGIMSSGDCGGGGGGGGGYFIHTGGGGGGFGGGK